MKIQDKLLVDKKNINKDIDEAIEKINEYIGIIDILAQKIETAKETLEILYNNTDKINLEIISKTLEILKN